MTTGAVPTMRSVIAFRAALAACTAGFLIPLEGPVVDSAMRFEWWSILPGDKLIHAAAFGGLVILAAGARRLEAAGSVRMDLLTIALGLAAYALATEACQHVLPWRSFEVFDLVADGLGIVLGALVAARTLRYRRRRFPVEP